jgi:hypothetical protein
MAVSSLVAGGSAVAVCADVAVVAGDAAQGSSLLARSFAAVSADAAPEADDRTRALAALLAAGVLRLLVAGRAPTPQGAPVSPLVASLVSRSPSLFPLASRADGKRSLSHAGLVTPTAREEVGR